MQAHDHAPSHPAPVVAVLVVAVLAVLGALAPASPVAADPTPHPSDASTGPRADVHLVAVTAVVVEQDGAVLEGLDIDGCLRIRADDVVIRDVRIRCHDSHGIDFLEGTRGGLVEHSELVGAGTRSATGIRGGEGVTVRHTDISGFEDGLKGAPGSRYEANYVHDLNTATGGHNDGLQLMAGGGVEIIGNTFDLVVAQDVNAGVWMKEDKGPIDGVLIQGNLFSGAGYHVKLGSGRNVVAIDNSHTDHYRWGTYDGDIQVRGAMTVSGEALGGHGVAPGGPTEAGRPDSAPAGDDAPGGAGVSGSSVVGEDAVAVALAVSRSRYPEGRTAAHAVLARSDVYADALAGAPLTAGGPLLLTAGDRLDERVAHQLLQTLSPGSTVHLLGGPAALSPAVERAVADLGLLPVRSAGESRIATALAVADVVRDAGDSGQVVLARADAGPTPESTAGWADAISGGAHGAAHDVPILLTGSAELDPAVAAWLRRDGGSVALLGGEAALSPAVARELPEARRVAGRDRAETAAAVARDLWQHPLPLERAVVIHGWEADGWAYGLAAAGVAADEAAPLLLLGDQLPPATRQVLGCATAVTVVSRQQTADGAAVAAIGEGC